MVRVYTTAELAAALPLDTVVTLGGKPVHTRWLGGDVWGGYFRTNRYGLALDPDQVDLDDPYAFQYLSAPATAVGIQEFTSALVSGGWSWFSARGENYAFWASDFGLDVTPGFDFATPPVTDDSRFTIPLWQHYWLCDLTRTYRSSDGGYALYRESAPGALAADVAAAVGATADDVVVLVIDGSGSFGSGTGATQYVDNFIAAYSAALPGNATRLVVTKFSDYPRADLLYGSPDDVPALHIGTWTGISPSITSAVIDAALSDANDTGSGGDDNESQFEGVWLGMQKAAAYTGRRAIVVYTDAASVVAWGGLAAPPSVDGPWLRALQRSDGLGAGGAPRAVQRATSADSLRSGTATT